MVWFDRCFLINASFCQQCIGRLQQHAALIGGPNATSCPLCHKMFLGGEALMEHMKHTHKDPNASGVASKYLILVEVEVWCMMVCGRGDTTDKRGLYRFFLHILHEHIKNKR